MSTASAMAISKSDKTEEPTNVEGQQKSEEANGGVSQPTETLSQPSTGAVPITVSATAATATTTLNTDAPASPDINGKAVEQYRARRIRQQMAKKRGPFVKDTATDYELPNRARAAAYRILTSETVLGSDSRLSAHQLLEFRKYVDNLIQDVKESPTDEQNLLSDQRELDEAVRGHKWWDLPRVERWLTEHIKNWADPIVKDKRPAPRRFVGVSSYGAKGRRQTMEDYHCTYLHWGNFLSDRGDVPICYEDEHRYSNSPPERKKMNGWLLGVFDGHNGTECAAFARDSLPPEIIASDKFPKNMEQACIESFKAVNVRFLERAKQVECEAGTTALVAFFLDSRLHLAGVGDCAGVISRSGRATKLTRSHTANDPLEAAAVEERGGTVRNVGGNMRVDGVISITRGLGCKPCTDHTSCVPELVSIEICEDDDFLVLASDGLWDVVSPQEAADFIAARKREADASTTPSDENPYKLIAQELCAEAVNKGTSDNVTVVIAFFNHA